MMFKIHSLDDTCMVKWTKIAFYQLQEKEIHECSDILALNQDQVAQQIQSWKIVTSEISLAHSSSLFP